MFLLLLGVAWVLLLLHGAQYGWWEQQRLQLLPG